MIPQGYGHVVDGMVRAIPKNMNTQSIAAQTTGSYISRNAALAELVAALDTELASEPVAVRETVARINASHAEDWGTSFREACASNVAHTEEGRARYADACVGGGNSIVCWRALAGMVSYN